MKLQNLIHIPIGIVLVLILAGIPASLGLAENLKTINGKEYKDAKISRVEPDGIVLTTKSGVSKVYFNELPRDVQERFHYGEPAKVEAELTVAINEERKKKDPEAKAIIAKTEEEFQTAEIQPAHAYEGSEKGTLSGQIAEDNLRSHRRRPRPPEIEVDVQLNGVHRRLIEASLVNTRNRGRLGENLFPA